jgi:glycosyltransferase involved in cell wall biosynthesis
VRVAKARESEGDRSARCPRVSAVITSFNYGRYLAGAIESVLAQTYPNLEVVVVDDGSTDETPAVAARFAARGVRYVYQPNAGAADARNTGARLTTAPLLAFLDADDEWLPDKIARQVAHLHTHPEIALVSSHADACSENMQFESVVHAARMPAGWILESLLVRNVVLNPTCVLVRREALERVGGFSDLDKWEDWDTWLRLSKLYPIGFIPESLAKVRRHQRGLSPQDGYEHLALDRVIFERHADGVDRAWRRAILRRRARSVSYFHFARLVGDQDRAAAARYARRALVLDPTTLTRRKLGMVARTLGPRRERTRRNTPNARGMVRQ